MTTSALSAQQSAAAVANPSAPWSSLESAVEVLKDAINPSGAAIPLHDETVAAYYGSTNNLHTVTYKLATVTVGVMTISYAGGGASDDDQFTGFVISY